MAYPTRQPDPNPGLQEAVRRRLTPASPPPATPKPSGFHYQVPKIALTGPASRTAPFARPTPPPAPPGDSFGALKGVGDIVGGIGNAIGGALGAAAKAPVIGPVLQGLGTIYQHTVEPAIGAIDVAMGDPAAKAAASANYRTLQGGAPHPLDLFAATRALGAGERAAGDAARRVASDTNVHPINRLLAGLQAGAQTVAENTLPVPGPLEAVNFLKRRVVGGRIPTPPVPAKPVARALAAEPLVGALERGPRPAEPFRYTPPSPAPVQPIGGTLASRVGKLTPIGREDLTLTARTRKNVETVPPVSIDELRQRIGASRSPEVDHNWQPHAPLNADELSARIGAKPRAPLTADEIRAIPVGANGAAPFDVRYGAAQDAFRAGKDPRVAVAAADSRWQGLRSDVRRGSEPPAPQGPLAASGIDGPLVGRAIGKGGSQLKRAQVATEPLDASGSELQASLIRQTKVHNANEAAIAAMRAEDWPAVERALRNVVMLGGDLKHTVQRIRKAGLPAPTAEELKMLTGKAEAKAPASSVAPDPLDAVLSKNVGDVHAKPEEIARALEQEAARILKEDVGALPKRGLRGSRSLQPNMGGYHSDVVQSEAQRGYGSGLARGTNSYSPTADRTALTGRATDLTTTARGIREQLNAIRDAKAEIVREQKASRGTQAWGLSEEDRILSSQSPSYRQEMGLHEPDPAVIHAAESRIRDAQAALRQLLTEAEAHGVKTPTQAALAKMADDVRAALNKSPKTGERRFTANEYVDPNTVPVQTKAGPVTFESQGDAMGQEYHERIWAVLDGKEVGHIDVGHSGNEAFIKMVEVDPAYRRQGIGSALMQRVKADGNPKVTVLGDVVTPAGRGLLDSVGGVGGRSGSRKFAYSVPGERPKIIGTADYPPATIGAAEAAPEFYRLYRNTPIGQGFIGGPKGAQVQVVDRIVGAPTKALAETAMSPSGPVIRVVAGLPQAKFETVIRHELEHAGQPASMDLVAAERRAYASHGSAIPPTADRYTRRAEGWSYAADESATRQFTDRPTVIGANEVPPTKGSRIPSASDILNIPRTLMTTADVSYSLRQGLVLGVGHPLEMAKAFGRQIRAFVDGKFADDYAQSLMADPAYQTLKDLGLSLTDWQGILGPSEEGFLSKSIGNAPVIRNSNRAGVTFLNSLRFNVAKNALKAAEIADPTIMSAQRTARLKGLMAFINDASGRGELPAALQAHAATLNGLFFSPRLIMSRFNVAAAIPKAVITKNPLLAKEAARDVAALFIGGYGILQLAQMNGAKVVTEPTSSDWGKIQVGNTRIDIWGGFQSYARFIAQMIEGKRTTLSGGTVPFDNTGQFPTNRAEEALRFARGKLAPIPAAFWNLAAGENVVGQPVTPGNFVGGLVTPLSLQDIYDAIADDIKNGGSGARGLAAGSLGLLGVGTQTVPANGGNTPTIPEAVGGLVTGQPLFRVDPKAKTSKTGTPSKTSAPKTAAPTQFRFTTPATKTPKAFQYTAPPTGGSKVSASLISDGSSNPPTDVRGVINTTARKSGIDPLLALATVQMESGFNPAAVGDGGHSHGLYQENDRGRGAGRNPDLDVARQTERFAADVRRLLATGYRGSPGEIAAAVQRPADPRGYAAKVNAIYRSLA